MTMSMSNNPRTNSSSSIIININKLYMDRNTLLIVLVLFTTFLTARQGTGITDEQWNLIRGGAESEVVEETLSTTPPTTSESFFSSTKDYYEDTTTTNNNNRNGGGGSSTSSVVVETTTEVEESRRRIKAMENEIARLRDENEALKKEKAKEGGRVASSSNNNNNSDNNNNNNNNQKIERRLGRGGGGGQKSNTNSIEGASIGGVLEAEAEQEEETTTGSQSSELLLDASEGTVVPQVEVESKEEKKSLLSSSSSAVVVVDEQDDAADDTTTPTPTSRTTIDHHHHQQQQQEEQKQQTSPSSPAKEDDHHQAVDEEEEEEEASQAESAATNTNTTTLPLPQPPIHPAEIATSTTDFIDLPSSERPLTSLRDHDYDKYTIRILSWKRIQFLKASIEHHSKCLGVEQIQVVWSTLQEDDGNNFTKIPKEILNNPKVVVERRDTNQLTNRFDIITPTNTLGILSLDDDLLYPCDVLDVGFFEWTQNPDRMITYFPRRHVVQRGTGKWLYKQWRDIGYSIGLTGTAFIHRDYWYWYTNFLPRPIYQYIQNNMNCEDIAMSLFISKLTNGTKPIAVDKWCMHSRIQLTVYSSIKNSGGHTNSRNLCIDTFADQLRVKELLGTKYSPGVLVSVGKYDGINKNNERQKELEKNRRQYMNMTEPEIKDMYNRKRTALARFAKKRGLAHSGSG